MSTITENINKIIQVKNDLNEVLRENGIEGGRVFEEYPEKFRQLFRIMESYTEEAVDEYTGPGVDETVVPDPIITFSENKITIDCPMKDATIYYMIKSKSGKNDIGYGPYETSVYIKEDVYVEAFARYNNIDSNKVGKNYEYLKGDVPNAPVIKRDGTTVTITCTGNYTSIWWSTVNGNYVLYAGPVTVSRTNDVWAYSTYNRFASDYAFDKAPEQIIVPEIPVIDTSVINKVTITCETPGATIWYMTRDDMTWIEYTGEIELEESGYYRATAILNDIQGMNSEWVYAEFYEAPSEPNITTSDNIVTITCDTEDAIIYYRKEGDEEWIEYVDPFPIKETGTYEAYSTKNTLDSDIVSVKCEYVAPLIKPVGNCTIKRVSSDSSDPNYNLIEITCQRSDATIYYKLSDNEIEDFEDHYTDLSYYDGVYEEPFYITEDKWIYAHGVREPFAANSWAKAFFSYVETGGGSGTGDDEKLNKPFITVSHNVVYMSTDVPEGTIYYKKANDDSYVIYNGGIPITETTTFLAYVTKDDKTSDIERVTCIYIAPVIIKPDKPTITLEDNEVTITCTTSGAAIYYRIDNGQWNIYIGPISITETCTIEAYSYKDGESSETVTKECEFKYPEPPIITCELNCITITSPDGGEIYYKIDDGEYTLYTGEFNITSQCTITAYVYKWNVDSELTVFECEYDDNIIYTSKWFNTNYYQYKLPFTRYSELTSTSQLYNKRVLVEGNDKVRFIEYKSGSSYKIFMQFEDKKFALYTKKGGYRLTSSNFFTTTELSKANALFQTGVNLNEFTSAVRVTDNYNIGLRTFNKDTYYITNDYSGRATETFKVPYLVSNSHGSMSITSKEMYLKYLIGISIDNITSNILRNGILRFKAINKNDDLPIIWQRYMYRQINGVTIWESANCFAVYNYYEVALV